MRRVVHLVSDRQGGGKKSALAGALVVADLSMIGSQVLVSWPDVRSMH
jgi:hypothetical protein